MKTKPQIRTTALGYVVVVVPIMQAGTVQDCYMVAGIAPNGHVTYFTSPFQSKAEAEKHRRGVVKLHRDLRNQTLARSAKRRKATV
jgi:hypothetical protein